MMAAALPMSFWPASYAGGTDDGGDAPGGGGDALDGGQALSARKDGLNSRSSGGIAGDGKLGESHQVGVGRPAPRQFAR